MRTLPILWYFIITEIHMKGNMRDGQTTEKTTFLFTADIQIEHNRN